MNSKGNRKLAASPTRQDKKAKPGLTGPRIVKVVLASVFGAAVLLTAFAFLTPLDEPQQVPTSAASSDISNASDGQTDTGSRSTRASSLAMRAKVTALEFPHESESIDVSQLQSELRELATRLQRDYPTESGAFHFAAQIYFELNQTEEAERAWRKSIELSSPAAGPYAGLAELLVGDGREAEAIKLLEQAHTSGIQSAETLVQLAESQEHLGELAAARATLDMALREYPEEADIWLAHGRVLNQLNEYAGAEQSLLQAIELGGESEKALFLLTTAQLRQRKRELAAETSQRLKSFREQGETVGSGFQQNYESALRGISVEVFLSAASLAENYARLAEAESLLWRAIRLDPIRGQAYMSLSSVLRKQARLGEAVQVHQQLVKVQPDNLLNYSNLASIALQHGEIELARSTLLEATDRDPQGVVPQALLAKLYLAEGQPAEAEKYAKLVLQRESSVESYLLMASILDAQGDTAGAQQAVAAAQALDPQHPIWKSE